MAAKREHGTGTVYYVESTGKWRARLIVDGKPISKSAATEKEAKALLKSLIRNQKDLTSKQKYNTRCFSEYIRDWLSLYKKNALAPSSYRSIEFDVEHYVNPHIGSIQLGRLTTDDIQAMIGALVRDERSLSVISRARSAVDSCLKKAVQLHDIPYNPCSAVEMPSSKKNEQLSKKPICVLSDDEIKQYVGAATCKWSNGVDRHRIGWGFVLVLSTGIRKGEAAALEWSDIDFAKQTMHISRNAVLINDEKADSGRKTKQIIQSSTKTSHGNRFIPLNKTAIFALEQLKLVTGAYRYVLGVSAADPINVSTLTAMHSRIMKGTQIQRQNNVKMGMHALRHTFCSYMIMSTDPLMDVKTISEIMGHADINITLDVYGHVFESRKRQAVQAADFINMESTET